MPASARSIVVRAFGSPEWRAAADALFEATGVTVNVMDFANDDALCEGTRCGYCNLSTDVVSPGPLACFDARPRPGSDVTRVLCRAGLPTLISAVLYRDQPIAYLVLGGFVTSTRERRRVYENLLARSANADSARFAIKALAVISRRQAEGCLRMALATARTLVNSAAEQLKSGERVEELRLFVAAGEQVVGTEHLDATTLGAIAEEAVAIIGGDAGAVLRPSGPALEVVARTATWLGAVGAQVTLAGTAAGRAYETGRTIVTPVTNTGGSTFVLPLTLAQRVVGVLEVRLPAEALPLAPDSVARLDRFGRFIAVALERDDERLAVERAMAGYRELNDLAAALGGQTDIDSVTRIVRGALGTFFSDDIAGVVLTGYGRDEAVVDARADVSEQDIALVLGDVAGRDPVDAPFSALKVSRREPASAGAMRARDDWATAAVELTTGTLEIGYLFVARADGGRYNAQDRALLDGIAAHAGTAFGRAALFARIRDDYAKTLGALSATLDAAEHKPSGHSTRVMDYAMLIGEELGLPFEDVEQLRFAGLLHDIGKTGVPSEILLKPSRLTAEEFARVQAHAEFGATIVDHIEFLKGLTPVILHHHERWDGSGYPAKLAGDSIPLLARVLAVADAFDALSTRRGDSRGTTFASARREIEHGAGSQFDPRVVAALLAGLDRMALAGASGLLAPAEAHGHPELLA